MSYHKKIRERILHLVQEGYSPEQVIEKLSKEEGWKDSDIPDPRTIRNWIKKDKEGKEKKSDSSNADARDEHSAEIHRHDREVFRKSDRILNEEKLEKFFDRLQRTNPD